MLKFFELLVENTHFVSKVVLDEILYNMTRKGLANFDTDEVNLVYGLRQFK